MAGLEIKIDPASRWVVAEEKLWLTADRERLVPAGHKEAAFLFTLPGRKVSVADAERYGLLKTKAVLVEGREAEGGQDETMLGEPLESLTEPMPAPGLHVKPEAKRRKVKKS